MCHCCVQPVLLSVTNIYWYGFYIVMCCFQELRDKFIKVTKQIGKQKAVVQKLLQVLDPGRNIKVRTGKSKMKVGVHCKIWQVSWLIKWDIKRKWKTHCLSHVNYEVRCLDKWTSNCTDYFPVGERWLLFWHLSKVYCCSACIFNVKFCIWYVLFLSEMAVCGWWHSDSKSISPSLLSLTVLVRPSVFGRMLKLNNWLS